MEVLFIRNTLFYIKQQKESDLNGLQIKLFSQFFQNLQFNNYWQMPPKAPKITEEEAKRLEEEKRKQEEEQARLELERKKYLSEKLEATDLVLPASAPLILDFSTKSLDFISEKLKICFEEFYPYLLNLNEQRTLNFILKELHYYIKDSFSLFGKQNEPERVSKHRIFVGIMTRVLVNGLSAQQQKLSQKSKSADERLIKQLAKKHCEKECGNFRLQKSDALKILSYAGQKYFGRYKIITLFSQFGKSKKETVDRIYIETPTIYRNSFETKWVDLSDKNKKQEQQKVVE